MNYSWNAFVMERIRFFKPEYLQFLWLVVPVAILLFLSLRSRSAAVRQLFGEKLSGKIADSLSFKRSAMKKILQISGLIFVTIALAGPQIGTRMATVKREGIDIVVAIDLSRSMLAEDVFPNRMERTKHEVGNFIRRLSGDRIALVGFTSKAYVQCPMTFDYDAALMFLDVMDNNILPQDGTSLSEAIRVSTMAFPEDDERHRLIVLISDGEDHEDGIDTFINEAKDQGIVIYTIGIGSPDGTPIPYRDGFLRDDSGRTVITRLNERLLMDIAEKGGGGYYYSSTGQSVLREIFEDIERIEKTDFDDKVFTDFAHRFQFFLFAGIFLLLSDLFLSETKKKHKETV